MFDILKSCAHWVKTNNAHLSGGLLVIDLPAYPISEDCGMVMEEEWQKLVKDGIITQVCSRIALSGEVNGTDVEVDVDVSITYDISPLM